MTAGTPFLAEMPTARRFSLVVVVVTGAAAWAALEKRATVVRSSAISGCPISRRRPSQPTGALALTLEVGTGDEGRCASGKVVGRLGEER